MSRAVVSPIAKPAVFEFNEKYLAVQDMVKTAFHMVVLAIACVAPLTAAAQQQGPPPLVAGSAEFVRQILARSGAVSAMSVSFQNISVLPPGSQEEVQNAVFTAFRDAGVRLVKPEMAQAQAEITFSENWQGYVWIANVRQPAGSKLVMIKVARPQESSTAKAPMMTLRKTLVWRQDSPILDFAQDDHNLAILEPGQVSIYVNESGQLRPRYTLAITRQQPWPRDLRGRLLMNGSRLTVFLPGTRCSGSISPPVLDCRASDDPWQIDEGATVAFYSSRRNFFTGLLAGANAGASVLPFFSVAAWQTGDSHVWLFSGSDGRTRLYQYDLSAPSAVFSGWGSDIAAVHSGCGSGWQTLVTAPTDSVKPDSVQAVEIIGREALPVSSTVELAGAVQAFWTAGKNGDTVNGVMQSPATGKYEAFTLSVSCGH
ncbi:MAG TPA: hypothetical protein VLT16_16860 [Candidatus Limnocylindrales bacterium]|nr:hypothetical protein [Candidatus Limnocylindrales bacterium]